ncbi:hypothetical protein CWI38_0892p0020 [Hamiltosporidium tvaerminnensis]|uniref:Uncharacterized protein n=1 Tax=Hamiltosporidium tvaerminnensis TaxID=1176355 RepID=A0A4Q9LWM7_9MICR|nr:hypothetical protein CWI38_0892p0020 [Hamiltosporidium tvaerminnensis]
MDKNTKDNEKEKKLKPKNQSESLVENKNTIIFNKDNTEIILDKEKGLHKDGHKKQYNDISDTFETTELIPNNKVNTNYNQSANVPEASDLLCKEKLILNNKPFDNLSDNLEANIFQNRYKNKYKILFDIENIKKILFLENDKYFFCNDYTVFYKIDQNLMKYEFVNKIFTIYFDNKNIFVITETCKIIVFNVEEERVLCIESGIGKKLHLSKRFDRKIYFVFDDGTLYSVTFDDIKMVKIQFENRKIQNNTFYLDSRNGENDSSDSTDKSDISFEYELESDNSILGKNIFVKNVFVNNNIYISDLFGNVYILENEITFLYSHFSDVQCMKGNDKILLTYSENFLVSIYDIENNKIMYKNKFDVPIFIINLEYYVKEYTICNFSDQEIQKDLPKYNFIKFNKNYFCIVTKENVLVTGEIA